MKKIILLLALLAVFGSCKKNNTPDNNQEPDNLVYRSDCTIKEIYWLGDNETILFNDFCNGTLKKINTVTKAVQLFDIVAKGHLLQRIFYSEQLPNYAFYIALTKDAAGSFSMPLKLFSLDLTTGNSVLIRDNITQLPSWGGYTMGNKKLAIKSATELLVIDLEHATTQVFPVSQNVQAFSPDDTKMLLYSSSTSPITATVYDFVCQCTQPKNLAGSGIPIWRTQGLFGYNITTGVLNYLNLESGTLLKSFPDFGEGPWVAQNGSLAILLAKGPTYASDKKALLLSFDLVTGQTKEIASVVYVPLYSYNVGIYLAAISPNQKKVAYVQDLSNLRICLLAP